MIDISNMVNTTAAIERKGGATRGFALADISNVNSHLPSLGAVGSKKVGRKTSVKASVKSVNSENVAPDVSDGPITRSRAAMLAKTGDKPEKTSSLHTGPSAKRSLRQSRAPIPPSSAPTPAPTPASVPSVSKKDRQLEDAQAEVDICPPLLPVPLCDRRNAADPNHAVQYVDRIYKVLKRIETRFVPKSDYLEQVQTSKKVENQRDDITEKMRSVVVDWLIEVHHKSRLRDDTLYLTTNLLDRYLLVVKVEKKNLQLAAVACLYLACKFEEIYPPSVSELVDLCNREYTRGDIQGIEVNILNILKFDLNFPNPYRFLTRFARIVRLEEKYFVFAQYLMELSLLNYACRKFAPSLLAASALHLTLRTFRGKYDLEVPDRLDLRPISFPYSINKSGESALAEAEEPPSKRRRVTSEFDDEKRPEGHNSKRDADMSDVESLEELRKKDWPELLQIHTSYSRSDMSECESTLTWILKNKDALRDQNKRPLLAIKKKYAAEKYFRWSEVDFN